MSGFGERKGACKNKLTHFASTLEKTSRTLMSVSALHLDDSSSALLKIDIDDALSEIRRPHKRVR